MTKQYSNMIIDNTTITTETMNTEFCESCRAYIAVRNNQISYASASANQYELIIDFEMKVLEIVKHKIISANYSMIGGKIKTIYFHNLEELQKIIKTYLLFQ